eukprot:NODE_22_length_38364_cov_0.248661.p4 type:complete len:638 gc:universal NODE_22_length_38364_cov_0.248661:8002-6089(-)
MQNPLKNLNRSEFDILLARKFVYPSFGIYGGYKGLFDYGPAGAPLMNNLIYWFRKFFIVEENMFELDTVSITPYSVLKTSGHVDRFSDWMIYELDDSKSTGNVFRVDHLIKQVFQERLESKQFKEHHAKYATLLNQLDNLSNADFDKIITDHQITSPLGKPLSHCIAFNLMFGTCLGVDTDIVQKSEKLITPVNAFMRPETAQSQFMHFNKLSELKELPVSCSIGKSFRNEISPRSGILRVREFLMGEIEHFVDPEDKSHSKFSTIKHLEIRLLNAHTQQQGLDTLVTMSIQEAVQSKIVKSEIVGYYLGRIHLFLQFIGYPLNGFRFRQHMSNEMAHYANDCWDTEVLTSHGWVEAIGLADRGCFDLTRHSEATGEKLVYRKKLETPKTTEELQVEVKMNIIGKSFKKDAKNVQVLLESAQQSELKKMKLDLDQNSKCVIGEYELDTKMISIDMVKKVVHVEEIIPHIIEPSFGFGRVLYGLMEQTYYSRVNDAKRSVFKMAPHMAPVQCAVLPLFNNQELSPIAEKLAKKLKTFGIHTQEDYSSTTIGKRYVRIDEIGCPYCITVDFDTLNTNTVTLRERDSLQQVRLPINDALDVISKLTNGFAYMADEEFKQYGWTWSDVIDKYTIVEQKQED